MPREGTNVNENNSMAYTQTDDAQNNSAQNNSVYMQDDTIRENPIPVQESNPVITRDNTIQSNMVTAQDNAVQTSPAAAQDSDVLNRTISAQNNPVSLQKDIPVSEPVQNDPVCPQDNNIQNSYPQDNPDYTQNDAIQGNPAYTQNENTQYNPNIAMPYNNTPLLQLNDLCKRYPGMGSYMSVFHMNLIIPRGRIIGLLGPNGCGKTTLIKMINGLLAPTCGNILINGMEPCPATKKVISYLPERTYLDNSMKVSQMVSYFADFYEDFSTEKAFGMLGALGISSDARLKTLSKGTKEKVQLILVMSRQADLYILDEPIAGVDPAARDYILRTIITNYNPSSTIILSTHLISDIENILDDVIFMKNGSLMLYTSVDSIRSQMGKSVDTYFREVYAC